MAWRKAGRAAQLYINGENFPLPARDATTIANALQLDGDAYASLSEAGRHQAYELLQAGHYRLVMDGEHDEHGGDEQ